MSEALDPRLHAFRPDLADEGLRGRVESETFVAAVDRPVVQGSAALRASPSPEAPICTEVLFGETFRVFEDREGWSWGQLATDGYVGYVPSAALGDSVGIPTHRVTALGTFLYPEPDLKLPPRAALSLGSRLSLGDEVEVRGQTYRLVDGGGAVVAAHVAAVDAPPDADHVVVAERFLNVPYLWGGRTCRGVDCSSLVQLSLMAAGIEAPRDSDLQERAIGHPVDHAGAAAHPGDFVFWPGHVGIMIDGEYMIHASGHHMAVVIEPLAEATDRIGQSAGPPTSRRRL